MEDQLPINNQPVEPAQSPAENEGSTVPVSPEVKPVEATPEVKVQGSVIPTVPDILKKAENQPHVSSEEKIWGLISYIPLLALMALVLKPSSGFIKLHGRQGLLVFLIFFFSIFVYLVPFIGPLIGIIIHVGMLAIGVFSMYQAFIGNWWKIPILGDIAELIPVEVFAKVTREAVVGAKVAEEIEQKSAEEEEAKNEKVVQSDVVQAPIVEEKVEAVVESQPVVASEPKNKDVQQELPIADAGSEQSSKQE